MEPATLVVILLIAAATLGILWLPMRKRWNDDGADDARRHLVERDVDALADGDDGSSGDPHAEVRP